MIQAVFLRTVVAVKGIHARSEEADSLDRKEISGDFQYE